MPEYVAPGPLVTHTAASPVLDHNALVLAMADDTLPAVIHIAHAFYCVLWPLHVLPSTVRLHLTVSVCTSTFPVCGSSSGIEICCAGICCGRCDDATSCGRQFVSSLGRSS